MNTFTIQVTADLLALFDLTDADDAIRAVIVTGSGRAFCAGADLGKGGKTFDFDSGTRAHDIDVDGIRRDGGGRVSLRIFRSLKPVIAAVNGAAVGVGATMTLPMDARIAASDARFGFVFSRRGLSPESCSSWFLPRLVGVPTALAWFYSGRVLGAEEALAKGLVQSLHPSGELLDAAIALARSITADSSPASVAVTRQLVWQNLGSAHPMQTHEMEGRAFQHRGRSADAKEGIASILEKRAAQFPDLVSRDLPEPLPWPDEPEFR